MKLIKKSFYIFTPLLLGLIVAFLIKNNIDYEYLVKPPFAPPSWLFPVMWTIIYFLIGLSFYLYKTYGPIKDINKVYYSQLFLNLLWPILFFNLKFRFIGTVEIIFLSLVVLLLLTLYFRYYKTSFSLTIPYFIWLLFATYLTFSIYLLN